MSDQGEFFSKKDAQEWRDWLDYEGGIDGFIHYGGPSVFPPSLRPLVEAYEMAFEALHEKVIASLGQWGVEF